MSDSLGYRILDRFELLDGARPIALRGAKVRALLAWFCLSGQRQIARARLADLLWSGSSEDKARASLRNALYSLRETNGGPPLLDADHLTVTAGFDAPPSELGAALARWDAGEPGPLAALSLENAELRFAADLFGLDAEFDAFLRAQQGRLLSAWAEALRARLGGEEPAEATRPLAERLRELVPQDETATRQLMLLDIRAGNSAAALGHYNRLWAVLDEEFDVEPSEATQELAIRVKSQAAAAPPEDPPARPAPAPGERITIYLRPFAAAGLPDETQMVIGGMRAEIMATLFAVEEWVVVEAEASAMLPARLGRYELRGTFSPGLGEVRLILSLKDLASSEVIWTRPLAVNRSDWMKNSAIAVQRLASLLTLRLQSHYIDRIGTLGDDKLPDYDKLVRARWLMSGWTAEADRRAEELMQSVTARGELGLRARIGLAELLNSRGLIFPGLTPPAAGVTEALALAESCVAEGAQRADVWLALAWAALQSGRIARAVEAADAALIAGQSSPRRMASAAEVLALSGQTERGAVLSEIVGRLDSGLDRVTLGHRVAIALLAGDRERCLDLAERADGAIVLGHAYAAVAAAELGARDRAAQCWQRFRSDLLSRWHGPAPPDPLDWFLAAAPVRAPGALDRIAVALHRIR